MSRRRLHALFRRTMYGVSTGPWIVSNRFVGSKLLPLDADKDQSVVKEAEPAPVAADGLAIPPENLWGRWGTTADEYLRTGARDADSIMDMLSGVGVVPDDLTRVLDFGCAEGRVLRFFPRAEGSVRWGVDLNAERITWAQQHLSPPLLFATTTSAPHLPFEDNHFDLVFGLSVFTHISDLADAWFLELLRVLRPGGHIWLTIHDRHTVEILLERHGDGSGPRDLVELVRPFRKETGVVDGNWVYVATLADPGAQVFYDSDYLIGKWSQFADCLAVKPEATGYQTALLFRKVTSEPG